MIFVSQIKNELKRRIEFSRKLLEIKTLISPPPKHKLHHLSHSPSYPNIFPPDTSYMLKYFSIFSHPLANLSHVRTFLNKEERSFRPRFNVPIWLNINRNRFY